MMADERMTTRVDRKDPQYFPLMLSRAMATIRLLTERPEDIHEGMRLAREMRADLEDDWGYRC